MMDKDPIDDAALEERMDCCVTALRAILQDVFQSAGQVPFCVITHHNGMMYVMSNLDDADVAYMARRVVQRSRMWDQLKGVRHERTA